MIRFFTRLSLRLFAGALLLYLVFFAQVGEHTLYEHGVRIAETPQARDLGVGVSGVLDDATAILTDGFGNPERPGGP